jgi:5'-methylthioadenosine phosphorylase
VKTAWGSPSDEVFLAKKGKEEICFIPRHGRGHKINPSDINFRANIDAMKQLGVTDIISVSAVGSLKENLSPGTFVIADQFIDKTFARASTFFDEEIVAHVSMAKPVSKSLGDCCESALKKINVSHQMNGTYIAMEGPQFSSLAESKLYRTWGADIIGMTNMPEAKLAREAEIRYCAVAMVTDFDCWHPEHDEVDVSMVIQTLTKNAVNAQNMIKEVIKTYKNFSVEKDPTNNCLDTAIITDQKLRTKKTIKKLKHIAGRILK